MPADILTPDEQLGFGIRIVTDGEERSGVDSAGLVEDLLRFPQPIRQFTDPGGGKQLGELVFFVVLEVAGSGNERER